MAKVFKIIVFIVVLAALAGGTAFYLKVLHPSANVAVVHPARGPAVQAVYATGTVEAKVMLPLGPRATGRLVELLADEGQSVTKGQVLARLEDDNLQKSIAELQAKAEFAQKDLERKTELLKKEVVSQSAVDQAQADRDAAQASVEKAQAELDFLKLVSPDNGTIIKRDGEIGQVIQAGQPVFWLSCCDGLRIEAEVDEEDIAQVSVGQTVVIHADAFPDKVFNGTVNSITPKGDPVSRSYRVRIGLEPDNGLMIGMTAETNIVIRKDDNALLIPSSAMVDGNHVLVEKGGKLDKVSVEIGARTPEALEVRQGIGDKDLIVRDTTQISDPSKAIRPAVKKWKAP